MIKVAILGCGKIADAHASLIKRIEGSEMVGVCDKEILMARQLYERYPVGQCFDDLDRMLEEARPDVVHITTPPQGHFELGRRCLEAGCHIYVEKPFTVNAKEAEELIHIAERKNLKVTVGHDQQFTHATREMRSLVKQGYLGGAPVHMESYYCYDFGEQAYAKALLGDKNHWVRTLPGTLMHNIISHGICRVAEFMPDDDPVVIAHGFVSPFLKNIGEQDVMDEVRVIIKDKHSTTAYFTFSSQLRPLLQQFKLYGTKNGVMIDHLQQNIVKIKGVTYKSYLEKIVPQCDYALQYVKNSLSNISMFLKNDLHMKAGMKYLIESFHKSILDDTPPPIPYREIILTSKIMDNIFNQIRHK